MFIPKTKGLKKKKIVARINEHLFLTLNFKPENNFCSV